MAHVSIREYDAKRLLSTYVGRDAQELAFSGKLILVTSQTDLSRLQSDHPWLLNEKLVVKPDQLFGKRGKHELVLLNASFAEVKEFIEENLGRRVIVNGVEGTLTHFLIEPFVEHDKEYYLAFKTSRDHDLLLLSDKGGVDIEENWETVSHFEIPILEGPDLKKLDTFLDRVVDANDKKFLVEFVQTLYRFFVDLGFVFFEVNPLTITERGATPLGCVAQIDDSAEYENVDMRRGLEFPSPFGAKLTPEEMRIKEMDGNSGSSLKLVLLNPMGRVWTLVAGGGASVIFADTISDLGYGKELANYGEYSGNPSEDETYEYTKTIIELMVKHPHPQGKLLIIGGAIANFTDVAKTFTGTIRALCEAKDQLNEAGVRIFVRRGGPNYEQGLALMKNLGNELGVPIQVFGPETYMTKIVDMAFAGEGKLEIAKWVEN
jgi:ATP-citrate lyase beta-subunit